MLTFQSTWIIKHDNTDQRNKALAGNSYLPKIKTDVLPFHTYLQMVYRVFIFMGS